MGDPSKNLTPISILLVDDHPILRNGLRKLLEMEPDLQVVGEAGTGEEGLALARREHPRVMLLDINLPNMNGLQVVARLKSDSANLTAVVLLTAYHDTAQLVHAMRSGASAFCPKDIEADRLLDVIRAVVQGKFAIGSTIYDAEGLHTWLEAQSPTGSTAADPAEQSLSPREMEILRAVSHGLSNKQIAYQLGISHQTVKNHMTSIMSKLKVEGRTQAAIYALQHGWVRAEEFSPSEE